MMRKVLFAGAAAIALAGVASLVPGAAYAQSADVHVMQVRLPDGSVQQIEYTGNVAPRIVIMPAATAARSFYSPFAMMQRISAEMDAQMAAMMHMMAQPFASGPTMAAFGGMPAGVCMHSVQVTYNGAGTPQVVSQTSGNCGGAAAGGPAMGVPGGTPAAQPVAPVARQPGLHTIEVKDQHPVGEPAYRALVPAPTQWRG